MIPSIKCNGSFELMVTYSVDIISRSLGHCGKCPILDFT